MKLSPAAEALFEPLSPDQRASAGAHYLAYLKDRDGQLHVASRTLSRREPFFASLAEDPVRSGVVLDAACFHRNHEATRPEEGLPPEMLWLLAIAKANRTESYGMEVHIVVNGILDGDLADAQAYVDMQEVYHTRILLDVLRCFDLDVEVGRPEVSSRAAVQAMIRLPRQTALPLILCGELVGVVVFRLLLDLGRDLFGDQPALWSRLSTLLYQIMIDEVGHVCWCRARLGRLGLRVARTLLPAVKAAVLADQRELARLVGRERFDRSFAELDIDDLTAGCDVPAFWLNPEGPSASPSPA